MTMQEGNPNSQSPTAKAGKSAKKYEEKADAFQKSLNPFSYDRGLDGGLLPKYSTGARALLRIAGNERTACNRIRWTVSYNGTPIHTIDSQFAWDIDVGQCTIQASLDEFMAPDTSPEAGALFSTMKASLHQPLVEMQVLDYYGSSLFFAKGMFTEVSGSVSRGEISNWSCKFTGISYQHFVNQNFRPYNSVAGGANKLLKGLKNIVSQISGGAF